MFSKNIISKWLSSDNDTYEYVYRSNSVGRVFDAITQREEARNSALV